MGLVVAYLDENEEVYSLDVISYEHPDRKSLEVVRSHLSVEAEVVRRKDGYRIAVPPQEGLSFDQATSVRYDAGEDLREPMGFERRPINESPYYHRRRASL